MAVVPILKALDVVSVVATISTAISIVVAIHAISTAAGVVLPFPSVMAAVFGSTCWPLSATAPIVWLTAVVVGLPCRS